MEGTLSFIIEWFDELAAINKQFLLIYYPEGPSVQINHTKSSSKTGGCFLKKVQYPNLLLEDLFIGNKFEIFSRKYTLVDFGDEKTRSMFQPSQKNGFMIIKPDAYSNIGKIIDMLIREGLFVTKLKMAYLDKSLSQYFAQQSCGGDTQVFKKSSQLLSEDVSVGVEVSGDDAVGILNAICGPLNPSKAKDSSPNTFSALFGTDTVKNAVYCSSDNSEADSSKFFSSTEFSCVLDNCTCCIIKPHCFAEGTAGQIIDTILSRGFEISAMGLFKLKPNEAKEFFEYSWSKFHNYKELVNHMTEGPCIVLEIRKEHAVEDFQDLVGDDDPREASSGTLRSEFGRDTCYNAVYCSSAKDEGIMECEYFFKLFDE